MEKDYCYEPYQPPASSRKPPNSCQCCFGPKTKKSRTKAFLAGVATNLGICILLFGYTLIGSIVFLAIEGGVSYQHSTTQILATTSIADFTKKHPAGNRSEMRARNEAARTRTVENIWEITVSLNILYRDNWTRLAAQEITRFQDELLKSMGEEGAHERPLVHETKFDVAGAHYEWTFAKAFLYSLTVLTTIGYGSIAPRTTLGKAVTMGYALLGIPLTLLYLSSIGSILSRVARGVFSRALCCCLCSNCGYCCYDEKRMAEKERRMRKRRQQAEAAAAAATAGQTQLSEPFYVRAGSLNDAYANCKEVDAMSGTDNESKTSMHGLSILAPILLCLVAMFLYICLGTFALYKLEGWGVLDGFYFCFMSLTTIGFGNMVPGSLPFNESNTTIWFCSIYIMSGMALTAMCFNVVHDEIVHRLKHQEKALHKLNSAGFGDDLTINTSASSDPYNMNAS